MQAHVVARRLKTMDGVQVRTKDLPQRSERGKEKEEEEVLTAVMVKMLDVNPSPSPVRMSEEQTMRKGLFLPVNPYARLRKKICSRWSGVNPGWGGSLSGQGSSPERGRSSRLR